MYHHIGKSVRIRADFSSQTIQSRRDWSELLQTLKGNHIQAGLMYVQNYLSNLLELMTIPWKRTPEEICNKESNLTRSTARYLTETNMSTATTNTTEESQEANEQWEDIRIGM